MSRDRFTEERATWLSQVADDPKLPPLAFKLAFRIAEKLNRQSGTAWPGIALLADSIGATERTVQKLRCQLVERGHLAVDVGGGRHRSNSYRLILKTPAAGSPFPEGNPEPEFTVCEEKPRPNVRETPSVGSQKPRPYVHPNLLIEPIDEPLERESDEDALFDRFWRVYPKRVAKGAARRAFRTALKQASPEEILAGAERYAGARAGLPARFTKHPATWLNGHCWLDEPDDAGKSTAERPEWIEGLAAFVNGERLQ